MPPDDPRSSHQRAVPEGPRDPAVWPAPAYGTSTAQDGAACETHEPHRTAGQGQCSFTAQRSVYPV